MRSFPIVSRCAGVGFLVISHLCPSYPSQYDPFFSFVCVCVCGEAVQLVLSSFSEGIISCLAVDLLCSVVEMSFSYATT